MKKSSGVLLIHDHKLCMILRDNIPTIKDPNTWDIVGGGGEEGEDFGQIIKREAQEEVSISPKNLQLVGIVTEKSGIQAAVYFAKLSGEEFDSLKLGNEGQKFFFFTYEEILRLPLYRTMQQLIEEHGDEILYMLQYERAKTFKEIHLDME